MKIRHQIYLGPEDLKLSVQRRSVRCFLCGPSEIHESFPVREKITKYLRSFPNTTVVWGEDLLDEGQKPRTKRQIKKELKDLQTIEGEFAAGADFTLLMLETPGAIAELGSFSMIPEIRSRLYVLVPSGFYGSGSYINRGPLSLIARYNSLAVIYYDPMDHGDLIKRIGYPLMLHKYAHRYSGYAPSTSFDSIDELIARIRDDFLPRYVMANIGILGQPHFTELSVHTMLVGNELNKALRFLFSQKAIRKEGGRYRLEDGGFAHELLEDFDTGALSRKRSKLVAQE